ncbi:MAG: MarC family protein [Actinomycetota bacterium]|jgi:multiple antibiotic resistance protein
MDMDLFGKALVTLLVIMTPLGNVPIFIGLTSRATPRERHRVAWQAVAVAGLVVMSFAFLGQQMLLYLGISMASLQVAGGFLLVLVALELMEVSESPRDRNPDINVAFVPLGTPLLAGPGTIVAIMVLMRQAGRVPDKLTVVLAVMCVLVVLWVALRFAAGLARILGVNVINLITRIMGLLLAAIAAQMIASGIETFVRHGATGVP